MLPCHLIEMIKMAACKELGSREEAEKAGCKKEMERVRERGWEGRGRKNALAAQKQSSKFKPSACATSSSSQSEY